MMNKNLLTHQLQNSLRQLLNGRTFVLLGQTGQVELSKFRIFATFQPQVLQPCGFFVSSSKQVRRTLANPY